MIDRRFLLIAAGCFLFISGLSPLPVNANKSYPSKLDFPAARAIVLIVADKMDSSELYETKHPAIRRFLAASSCGLMSIRSGAGCSDSSSGYLSLGAGGRSIVDSACTGAYAPDESRFGGTAGSYLSCSSPGLKIHPTNLTIPEMGLLLEQARKSDLSYNPGSIGDLFRENGWKTCLLGNADKGFQTFHPGGLMVCDSRGLIDEGDVSPECYRRDPSFPYHIRVNIDGILKELKMRLDDRKLIVIEFADFYRLDAFQNASLDDSEELISPERLSKTRGKVWRYFNRFMEGILKLQKEEGFSVILVSPSISQVSTENGNQLAPIVILDREYPSGILTSGTTKWFGLVANGDFLPTLSRIAGLQPPRGATGRVMISRIAKDHIQKLTRLNNRLSKFRQVQRPLLNTYMGIIIVCWIAGLLCLWRRKYRFGRFVLTVVMTVPLAIILMPVVSPQVWGIPLLIAMALVAGSMFYKATKVKTGILIISGLLWGILVVDQILGWKLIRFSALGYSAVDGSRFYGIGNEYMGGFLAASLIMSHLLVEKTLKKWPVWFILGITMGVLCLPQLGAKFGGILSGAVGVSVYLASLYQVKLNNKKFWIVLFGFGLILLSIGVWDSIRPPEIQTHIGRFIHLLWTKDYGAISQIIIRKLHMNSRLTLVSPWMRIILLSIVVSVVYRRISRNKLIKTQSDGVIWRALLVTGIAGYLVNDAGVLALATCLAYGFTYIFMRSMDEEEGFLVGPKAMASIDNE